MNTKKLALIIGLCVSIVFALFATKTLASSSQDFTNDVKTGLIQQQSSTTVLTDRKDIENGENATAGDSSEKNIPEVNVEKVVETEISTESSNTSSSSDSNKSSSDGSVSSDSIDSSKNITPSVSASPTVSTSPSVSVSPSVTTTVSTTPTVSQDSGN